MLKSVTDAFLRPSRRPQAAPSQGAFRSDIEGLRGVAILLVLLFHGTSFLPGGFVGVDVFFVISGFLITDLLLRELSRTGTVNLRNFYARRMRRLVPAASVVIAVTMVAAFVILPPLDRSTVMIDGAASATSLANFRFALSEGDYFQSVSTPSPFLHFWSLALEEQFYLVWPFLLLLVSGGRNLRRAAGGVLLVIFAASFIFGVFLTDAEPNWAYYSLPSRAWQFAAGGLLACSAGSFARIGRRPAQVVGWAAAAALVIGVLASDGTQPYPGVIALVPTLSAAALIATGHRAGGPGALLNTAPLRFLGRISYSLYLWHWPLLVLAAAAWGGVLPPLVAVAVMGAAVAAAWLSWGWVEQRFRAGRSRQPGGERATLRFGLGAIGAVAVLAIAFAGAAEASLSDLTGTPSETDQGGGVAQATDGRFATDPPPAGSPGAATPAATPSEPSPSPTAPGPTPVPWTAIPEAALPSGVHLSSSVRPTLAKVRDDKERLFADGCLTSLSGTKPATCVYGDPNGKTVVVLVGDSHASHLFPALNVLASRHGWKLLPFVKASCPFIDVPVMNTFVKREYTQCATWRKLAIAAINAAAPDLVLTVTAYEGIFPVGGALSVEAIGEAMARSIARIDAPVAIILDNPRTDVDIPSCLSRHLADVNACAIPRSMAFPKRFAAVEQVAAGISGAHLIDVVSAICPSTPCPVVRDGMILYRDGHHLSATFVRSLADRFDLALTPLLTGGGAGPTPTPTPTPTAAPTPTPTPSPGADLVRSAAVLTAGNAAGGGLEPIVATHPTDPAILAVAYERPRAPSGCSRSALRAAIAISHDGGRTWTETAGLPWAGSGRISSFHSAVAWGPGPTPGSARLYWVGTTTTACGGDLRPATAWSDDEGKTWSRLVVASGTPPWVGGVPDITSDRNPASPGFGNVWYTYNFPASGGLGAGVRLVASHDFGRTWVAISLPRAAAPAGHPFSWRFGHRVRTAPDGSAFVSWYQADLAAWDPKNVFERGASSNVGRIAFVVAHVSLAGDVLKAEDPVAATKISINAWTLSHRMAPGTGGHYYSDPIWSHGLDVDPTTGTVYLAVANYAAASGDAVRGTVRVGRSLDQGRTWTWVRLPAMAPVAGYAQSLVRPTLSARGGIVIVGVRTIEEVPATAPSSRDARIGAAWTVSRDGGASFAAPILVPGSQWRSSYLRSVLNGPGTRERIDLAADQTAVFAYGASLDPKTGRPVAGRSTLWAAVIVLPGPIPVSLSLRRDE